jgi:hypothetical protein
MPRAKGQLAKTGGRTSDNLTDKQLAFCEAYLENGFVAKAAAVTAGYNPISGARNLRVQKIRDYIDNRLQERVMRADEVLVRLSEQARGEYASYINGDGSVDIERMVADGMGHLIKELRETRYGIAVKFVDSQVALAILAKHHGLASEKVDVNVKQVSFSTIEVIKTQEPTTVIIEGEIEN